MDCEEDQEILYGDLVAMNVRFVEAMTAAIRKGLEQPPMIGVDKRHVGKQPKVVEAISSEVRGASCLVYAV